MTGFSENVESQGAICPACGYDNIAGTDVCEECNQSLSEQYMEDIETAAETSIFTRPLLALNPRPAECVGLQTSIAEAISRLQGRNMGCVLVTGNEGELAGIFTERDVLYKVVGLIGNLDAIPVESLMTPGPSALKPSDPISHALHLMGIHGFRHVPSGGRGRDSGRLHIIQRYCPFHGGNALVTRNSGPEGVRGNRD